MNTVGFTQIKDGSREDHLPPRDFALRAAR